MAKNEGLNEASLNPLGSGVGSRTPSSWRPAPRCSLDQRWQNGPEGAGSWERDGALDWRGLQTTPGGAWSGKRTDARLWRARTPFGWYRWAWTGPEPSADGPATRPFVSLSQDEGERAPFALLRAADAAPVMVWTEVGGGMVLEVKTWLPRPEYRWLSLHAEPLSGSATSWLVASAARAEIEATLRDRLGLR